MGKIYKRSTLIENSKVIKTEKKRRRNIIINFRVSSEEKKLIEDRVKISGLTKSEYFINSCLNQEIKVVGNIKTFDIIKSKVKIIDKHLSHITYASEIDLEILESLRCILEILDNIFSSDI